MHKELVLTTDDIKMAVRNYARERSGKTIDKFEPVMLSYKKGSPSGIVTQQFEARIDIKAEE